MDQTKNKSTRKDKKNKQNTSPGGGSAHKDQSTGNFTATAMIECIAEIKKVEAEAAAKGAAPKLSWNHICKKYEFKQNSTFAFSSPDKELSL